MFYLIRILSEIGEECRGSEPGDGEQRKKEASCIDTQTHITYFTVLPRARPDSEKQLFHEDESIKGSTSYLFLTRSEIMAM